jgi:hypothetical protein
MNRDHEQEELIELGAASAETKGPTAGKEDVQGGFIPLSGLNDE